MLWWHRFTSVAAMADAQAKKAHDQINNLRFTDLEEAGLIHDLLAILSIFSS